MTRRAALAGGLLAIAAVLSSCSSPSAPGSDVVASANGVELTRTTLAGLVDSSSTDSTSDSTDSTESTVPTTEPSGVGTSAADTRTVMTNWLRLAATGTDMSAIATRADLAAATEKATAALAEPFLGAARDVYATGWDSSPSVCLAIIPLAEADDPQTVLDALTGGMSFADAAAKYSADPQTAASGGVITFQNGTHCADPASLNPTVIDTMKGSLPGEARLVTLANGSKGIIVIRPFDELTTDDQISIDPTIQQQVDDARAAQIADGDFSVASRYGRWDDATASVQALTNE